MSKQLIINIMRSQFLAECDALEAGRDYFDIDTRESVLQAYINDFGA